MFFLIWGSNVREVDQGGGDFHCPQCGRTEDYRLIRVATYAHIFFIPLGETADHGEHVLCTSCHGQFRPEVLDRQPPRKKGGFTEFARTELEAGTPIAKAIKNVILAGVSDKDATEAVREVIADVGKHGCATCNLWFLASVPQCSGCGNPLAAAHGASSDAKGEP